MKSDALFYQLFQTAPQIFFELIKTTPMCPYRFTSVTFKTAEKRLDGLLEPTQPGHPIYFIEVQAEKDESIYWRMMHEISLYFEQNPLRQNNSWFGVVIWFDKQKDPQFGLVPITTDDKIQRISSVKLPEILTKLPPTSLALNVLRPFIVDNEAEVRQNFVAWVQYIQHNNLDHAAEQRLIEVLSQLIEQKFRTLNYKELAKMLNLTPFKETDSFKEAMQEVLQDNNASLLLKQIKHKFRFAERTMNKLTTRLRQLALPDLEQLFELILEFKTLKQINTWIDERLNATNSSELSQSN